MTRKRRTTEKRRKDNGMPFSRYDTEEKISALKALEKRREQISSGITGSKAKIRQLRACYELSVSDIDKLKKESISTTFQRLIHFYDGKINREMLKMLEVKLTYEREKEHLSDLKEEIKIIDNHMGILRKNIEDEQAARKNSGTADPVSPEETPISDEMMLADEIDTAVHQIVLDEGSLKLANKVSGSARAMFDLILKAEELTVKNEWGPPGLVSRTKKLSFMDTAQSTVSRFAMQIKDLEKELSDVHLSGTELLSDISSERHMVDFWLDTIMSGRDMSLLLKTDKDKLVDIIRTIDALIETLDRKIAGDKSRLSMLEKQKEELARARS
jgi:hypothetical protein